MSREALARAQSGTVGLGESPSHDAAPVDRLHAVGAAQRAGLSAVLGFELVRLKLANVRESYPICKDMLSDFLFERADDLRINRNQSDLIAAQAIMEYVIEFCPRCGGTGEVKAEVGLDGAQRMKPCPTNEGGCGGHGRRRYTDDERAEATGILKRMDRAYSAAHAILGGAIQDAMRNYRRLLK